MREIWGRCWGDMEEMLGRYGGDRPEVLACVASEHRVPPTASRMAASPEEARRESQKPAPAALIA